MPPRSATAHARHAAPWPNCLLPCRRPRAAHKDASGCSGKRDRTAFVGRSDFDERTFFSDYRFLEEVKLADDVAKRSKPPAPKLELPQFLQTLQYQARRYGHGHLFQIFPSGRLPITSSHCSCSTRWPARPGPLQP